MPLSTEQALAYLDANLAKRDPEIIKPLYEFTWPRDLPQGSDIDRTVEAIVLRNLEGAAQGNTKMKGRSWIGRSANDLKGVSLSVSAKATRVFTGGREASWTSLELERAQTAADVKLDSEQIEVINTIFQEEANDVGYLGDTSAGIPGLLNSSEVKRVDGAGVLSVDDLSTVNITSLISQLNEYQRAAEENANDVVMPTTLLVSPKVYSALFSLMLPDAVATNIIDYICGRSLAYAKNGRFQIYSVRELAGAGKGGKDRAVLYTPDARYVKYNVLPMWREKTYDKGLQFCAAYLWRIAEVQFRHPETLMYIDNI